MGGAVRGGGSGNFGIFRGASRRANPRLAPRVRPHPPRGPGARRGRMGPEVGPAFQRLSRATLKFILGVRFGGNGVQALFALFAFLSRVGARDLGIPAFAPRFGPPHTRAPGAQMVWMESGKRNGSVTETRSLGYDVGGDPGEEEGGFRTIHPEVYECASLFPEERSLRRGGRP
eukprot:gene22363-biopygen11745